MKYALIARCGADRVAAWCRVLGVSRSGYYDWRRRGQSQRQRDDERLLVQIRRIHQRLGLDRRGCAC